MQDLKTQFDALIAYNIGISNPKTEEVFNAWKENKKDFIRMFGDKLIYEYGEVSLYLSAETKKNKAYEFANRVAYTYNNSSLAQFIENNVDTFYENKVSASYGNVDVPMGMKLIKAFKYYENSESLLRRIQDEASVLIQEDKITGTLCFSVHPLDFMSSSENTYNWRSCHSLDGEYVAGNLSYMADHSTIICYIKGKEDATLPNFNFPWNNKKWRMLIHFSEKRDMFFLGRQYPFFSEGIFYHLNRAFDNMLISSCRTPFDNFMINDDRLYDKYINIQHILYPLNEIIKDMSKLHYNDLLYSTCYTPYYSYRWDTCGRKDENGEKYLPEFKIGYEVKCLECGECNIDCGEGKLVCYNCDSSNDNDYYYCDCCGDRIYPGDEVWVNGGDLTLCSYCTIKHTFTCSDCGTLWYDNDVVYIEEDNVYVCPYCFESRNENTNV